MLSRISEAIKARVAVPRSIRRRLRSASLSTGGSSIVDAVRVAAVTVGGGTCGVGVGVCEGVAVGVAAGRFCVVLVLTLDSCSAAAPSDEPSWLKADNNNDDEEEEEERLHPSSPLTRGYQHSTRAAALVTVPGAMTAGCCRVLASEVLAGSSTIVVCC